MHKKEFLKDIQRTKIFKRIRNEPCATTKQLFMALAQRITCKPLATMYMEQNTHLHKFDVDRCHNAWVRRMR